MTNLDTSHELRNGDTIRAYLDELTRLKATVRLWAEGAEATPFETTLQNVTPVTFTTTTTPPLAQGQVLGLSFMLDARRFVAKVKVVASGVFRIPLGIALGERRAQFRGAFERGEPGQVLAVEECSDTVLGGRTLQGRLLDLSPQGLRVALDESGALSGRAASLKVGDRFAAVCISALPFTPQIHGRARVVHVAPGGAEPHAGFSLEGISEGDQKNIERILVPRYPTTFGETFPARKRKTDLADRLGAPTPVMVIAKAPEIVGTLPTAPAPAAVRPETSAVMRLRKVGRKILLVSDHPKTPALAEAFRQDGFKQVSEAKSFPEAKALASEARYDLLVLDIRVGRHWAGDMLKTLHDHELLLDTPVILLADYRNDGSLAIAGALKAVCLHERGTGYEELVPVVYKLLLE